MIIPILNANENLNVPTVTLIYKEDCGWCTKFKPMYLQLVKDFENNNNIQFRIYDYGKLGKPKFTRIPIETVPHILFSLPSKKGGINKEMKFNGTRTLESLSMEINKFFQ